MSNARAATLIAERLPTGIPHPGADGQKPFMVTLPGLRSTGIPPEMAAQFAQAAGLPHTDTPKLVAEAVVNLLETDGQMTIIDNADLAQLRQDAADAPDGTRIMTLRCTCHGREVFQLVIGKGDRATIDPGLLARAVEMHEAS